MEFLLLMDWIQVLLLDASRVLLLDPPLYFEGLVGTSIIGVKNQNHSTLGVRVSKSESPASITQIELTGNGFAHAAPNSLLTIST